MIAMAMASAPIVQLILEVPTFEPWGDDWAAPSLANPDLKTQYQRCRALWGQIVREFGVDIHVEDGLRSGGRAIGLLDLPPFIQQSIALAAASGVSTAVYQLLKAWVDARNGRKLKIRVGDIEVEATQMKEEDVLRIFEILQEKADREKIRAILTKQKD